MQGGFGPKIGIRKGDVLAGKYRVDWVLGTGSTGVVLAAYHLKLHERVAIKLLLPEALSNPEAVQRFEREARAAVKIKSEHVARIIDVGSLDEGAPFIVMEHLQGEDLAARLARTGPLPVEEAVDFVMQACEAIAEAHGLGIIHRDLKPANLFCVHGHEGQSTIKVLDFGISKVLESAALHVVGEMTKTSVVVGSPFYMSPEQMQAPRTVDARTDIWSIGIILHELLAGKVPFGGETLPQIAVHVAKSAPPSLRLLRPEIPAGLEAVIGRCLEKNPKKRFKSVAELAAALGKFGPKKALSSVDRIRIAFKNASERPFSISVPPDTELQQQAEAGTSPSSWGAATTKTIVNRGRRGLAVALGASLALGVAVGLWRLRGGSRAEVASRASESNAVAAAQGTESVAGKNEAAGGVVAQAERPPADDPTRAYTVTPGAPIMAVPPPTGTGRAPELPRGRVVDNRGGKATLHGLEAESGSSPSTSRGAAVKGEGTCLLRFNAASGVTVVLDGSALSGSSKAGISVWAGAHNVVFKSADGQTKKATVACAAGETKTVDGKALDAKMGEGTPAEGAREQPCPLCERP